MNGGVVDPHNASRDTGYLGVIEQIAEEGTCPFCSDSPNFLAEHKQPVLREVGSWLITRASWPYQNSQEHFLLILRNSHVEKISELLPSQWNDLFNAIRWIEQNFNVPGGAFAMRFGDTKYTGATVNHLHAHLIVPEVDEQTNRGRVVNFPVGG